MNMPLREYYEILTVFLQLLFIFALYYKGVMGLFGCTYKSVAIGIPLINAIYEENPLVGFYTLPLLIWYPMQLIIGTFLSPRLSKFVEEEEERLASKNNLVLQCSTDLSIDS